MLNVRTGLARRGVRPLVVALLALLALDACGAPDPDAIRAESEARGEALLAREQYAEAAEAFRAATEAAPLDGELRLKLSHAYERSGQWVPAATEAVRAADLLSERLDAQIRAARLMTSTGRFVDGLDRAGAVLERDPGNVEALVVWANATARLLNSTWALYRLADARSLRDFDAIRLDLRPSVLAADDAAAESALRRAVALAPTHTDTRLALANFLWAAGRLEEGEPMVAAIADELPGHATVNHALGRLYLLRGQHAEGEEYLENAARTGVYGRGARLALADHYLETRRYTDALAVLTTGADDEATGDVARRVAVAEFQSGRHDAAMSRLAQLLERDPTDGDALLIRAQFLIELGEPGKALPSARAAVRQMSASAEAQATLGRILSATGDDAGAHAAYAEAVRLSPADTTVQAALARASLALGRAAEALQFAREVLRRHPGDRDARLLLIRALIATGDYAAAERELHQVLAREPDQPEGLIELGTLHAARGNRTAARAAYSRALEARPDSLEAVSGLVSLDLTEHRIAAARGRAEAALATRPRLPGLLLLAARVYEADKDIGNVEIMLRRVLDNDPFNPAAALWLARVLREQRRAGEAVRLLQEVARAHPDAVEARTMLAGLLEEAGRAADARTEYEDIVRVAPDAATASLRLATLLLEEGGDLDRALELATAVTRHAPDDAEANGIIGAIYLKRELPRQALPFLERAVRGSPDSAVHRYHLGTAYMGAGRFREGRQEIARALEIDPGFPHAGDARSALGAGRR